MAATSVRRRALAGALTLAAIASPAATAHAQGAYGYVFGAPGAISCCGESEGTLHFGGGGEFVTPIGVGVGAELGFLGTWDGFSEGIGVFSVNGSYHFARSRGRKLDPFVTAGYSLAFRQGHANMGNVGGGANIWLHPRVGLRLEFRDHLWEGQGSKVQYWGLRIGAAFR